VPRSIGGILEQLVIVRDDERALRYIRQSSLDSRRALRDTQAVVRLADRIGVRALTTMLSEDPPVPSSFSEPRPTRRRR
jgi:hypothetical protein